MVRSLFLQITSELKLFENFEPVHQIFVNNVRRVTQVYIYSPFFGHFCDFFKNKNY